ncbi:MAG: FAD-dependent oxidoreductase [Desulfobacterales bacterium]|nr:FAD-dependent oxidoreductase [Desulfobacterales bacterium]
MTDQKTGAVLVVGGGISGIQASLDLAESGYYVYLSENQSAIGGVMAQLDKTFPTNDCSMCIISPKLVEAGRHLNIELLTMTHVDKVEGGAGNFTVTLGQDPRFIDMDKCTACGECAKVCPVEVPNQFDQGLRRRKAAFKLYPQAMPSAFAIEKKGVAPCKAACPVNPSIQGCMALIGQGKIQEAFELFRSEHPFPGICGRVCHQPCESACTRKDVDRPLAIRSMHRFLADWARDNKIVYKPEKKAERKEKIAVIGAGPAGLACAYFMAMEGYQVTVFEKSETVGGMLSQGIPAYRLPRDVIEAEIDVIRSLGVTIRLGVDIGKDLTVGKLREEGYGVFFIGVGSQECKILGIENEEVQGVYPGIDFLRDVNAGEKPAIGDRVAVIGGGNVAMDSVRSALRLGAKQPFVVYRRSEAEMPANEEEIAECREEGIEIMTLTNPVRIIEENGQIRALECIKMRLGEPDASGRRRPEPIEESEFTIEVDAVIPAIGQESDWACLTDECACTLSDWGTMQVDPVTFQSDDPDIFAGGDAVSGPATVVAAISAGKEAAVSMDRFLRGEDLRRGREEKPQAVTDVDIADVAKIPRQAMPCRPADGRKDSDAEVQLGFDEETVRKEAARCLACGVCSECHQCVEACLAKAVDHDMGPARRRIQVGAVVMAPGFEPFNPSLYATYSYASHPNVVTSLEFERMLSASGPYEGHLVRPSDQAPPKKIAWLQCVGSRDINNCDHGYCSSVCCMYAGKQAVIAKEHSEIPLDTTIFFMDMRTFGKDFDAYQVRAEFDHGVRFVRSRIHSVDPTQGDRLRIVYATEGGRKVEERFDLVVLSIGFSPSASARKLAQTLDVRLNDHGFADTRSLSPVRTSRDGVFVCGAFQEPKDIPYSVMEASASAAEATGRLSEVRWSLTRTRDLPPETDFSGQPPRIGVFVCNCGINIGGVADVPAVRDYAATLDHVVHVEDKLFTCAQDSQDHIKEVLKEKRINRVVIAACSPRTHEPLFQDTIREAGLNRYLFEMANIRDQNTWVHMAEPQQATDKAKDLVRMAVAKAALTEPLHQVLLDITHAALVVGGGVAGMEAALGIADQGCQVHLVERGGELGGVANLLRSTWQGEEIGPYLAVRAEVVRSHPNITLHMETVVARTTGSVGNFTTTLAPAGKDGPTAEVAHGVTVLATGGREYQPEAYQYGKHPDVLTHLDMDAALTQSDPRIERANSVVFIQCVGSRNADRPYCSKICCTHSLKSALAVKKANPKARVFVLYRDIRSYGFREEIYKQARAAGVIFIRYDLEHLPEVTVDKEKRLRVSVRDHVLRMPVSLHPDLLVLASAVLANENKALFELFKVPVNSDGFLVEAHAKLRPVDFASEGIFLAGLAHYPKPIEETIAQAKAAASRAMTILAKEGILAGGVVATINANACAGCLTCVRECPYGIPQVTTYSTKIDPSQCHGCGVCAAECPAKAITMQHFTDPQLIAKVEALFAEESGGKKVPEPKTVEVATA